MPYDVIVGRSPSALKKFGKEGLVMIGRTYVKMGRTTSLSNYIYMDVAKGHVVYIVGKRGSGKCVNFSTPIQLEDGRLKIIEELFEENRSNSKVVLENDKELLIELKDKFKVKSMDHTMKLETMPVSHIYRKKIKEDLIRIKTRGGRNIQVTQDHPLFQMNGELSWTEANKLNLGSHIALPRSIEEPIKEKVINHQGETLQVMGGPRSNPIQVNGINQNFSEFLGYVVSEGCEIVKPNHYRIMFTNNDKEKLDRFKELVKTEFGIKATKKEKIVYFNSMSLKHYLKSIGYKTGGNSWTKEIPDCIMKDKELLRSFLKAYIGREAYMDKKKPDMEITTASKKLATQVAYGLLRFGIFARVITKEKYASNTEAKTKREYNCIYISGKENLRKFINEIGMDDKKEEKRLIAQLPKKSNPNFNTIPHVGQALKYSRQRLGILCRQLHRTKQVMKAYEDGKYNPSRAFLSDIASGLENKYNYLVNLCIESENNPNPLILRTLRRELRIPWTKLNKVAGAPYCVEDIFRIKKYTQKEKLQTISEYLVKKAKEVVNDEQLIEYLLRLKYLSESDLYWDEITEIKKIPYEGYVYDLTVPQTHNFIAGNNGGLICHNSYTLGVIAEGMIDLPEDVRKNLSIIMLDTMGIYWTMKYPNEKDYDLLNEWGLHPKGLDVKIYTPFGFFDKYKDEGIPTDFPFSLKPSELSAEDWRLTFQVDSGHPSAIVLSKVLGDFEEKNIGDYDIDDMIDAIKRDKSFESRDKNDTINRLRSARRWGLFSKEGSDILEVVKGGQVTVLDVSCYANTEGGWGVKALVLGLLGQKVFNNRMLVRKEEELDAIKVGYSYFQTESEVGRTEQAPIVWMILDEAHEFLPKEGKTAATDALVTIMREGRQPGVCLIVCTQQPGKIHTDVMSQSDIVIAHRLTAKPDVDALATMSQSYLAESLPRMLDELPRVQGAALILDDNSERFYPLRVRPRFTWHGGEAPSAVPYKRELDLGLD